MFRYLKKIHITNVVEDANKNNRKLEIMFYKMKNNGSGKITKENDTQRKRLVLEAMEQMKNEIRTTNPQKRMK